MRILSSIKSMSPPVTPTTPKEPAISLFGAAKIVSKVIHEIIVQRKADASDTLRAMLSKPENGELLNQNSTIRVGDLIVIAPQEFQEADGHITMNPHGLIALVTSEFPATFDIYEMALNARNEHTIFLNQPVATRHVNVNMHYTISPQVSDERVTRYITRHLAAGTVYRLKVCAQDVYIGAMQASEDAEKSRQQMSKRDDSTAPSYYGSTNCNNFVYETVKRALEIRNNGS